MLGFHNETAQFCNPELSLSATQKKIVYYIPGRVSGVIKDIVSEFSTKNVQLTSNGERDSHLLPRFKSKILIKSCLKTVCGDRFRTTGLTELDLDQHRIVVGGSNCNTGG